MEPLENGQIQPLGLSHAIGPPGWRPYFQRGIPSTTKASGGHFLWHPLAPPLPPPLAQGPTAGRFQGPRHLQRGVQGATRPISVLKRLGWLACLRGAPGPPWPPLAPSWPPLAPPDPLGLPWPPGPPGPPWPSLAPPWPPLAPPLLVLPASPGFGSPLAPPGSLAPPWPPPGPPLAPPGPPWPALAGHKKECIPVLAAKAEVGIEGASSKP